MPSDVEHRLHPVSVLFGLLGQVTQLAVPLLVLLVTAGTRGWDWEWWVVFLVVPGVVLALARYLSFRYRYDPQEMVFRSGILFRSERHVPYNRIQNLDAVQNVLHRLLGVVEVRVETGSGREPEARLSVIPVSALEEMRHRVFPDRAHAPTSEDARQAVAARDVLLHLSPKDLMLFGIIQNRGVLVIAALFGLLWEGGLMEVIADRWLGGIPPALAARGLADRFLTSGGVSITRVLLGFTAFLVVLLGVRVLSMGWALVRLYGFTVSREGDDLRAEFGLFTRVSATIPIHRIQTVTVEQGLLHRWFGRASVRVSTAGGSAAEAVSVQREWLAPIVEADLVGSLVAHVLPNHDPSRIAWQRADPRAFARECRIRLARLAVVALVLAPWLRLWAAWFFLLLAPVSVTGAWFYVRHLGWALPGPLFAFRSGWIRRRTSLAPFGKIQVVSLRQTPFDRRLRMARVRVDTAGGGTTSHAVEVPYLPRATAEWLRSVLVFHTVQTEFKG